MARETAFDELIKLLMTRRFGTLCFASLLSNIGTWAQNVAQPWLLLSLGASPFLLGLDSFAMGAPVWVLTLLGGVLADRSDRRLIILVFQSIQMLCPLALVLLLVVGAVQPWMVIALSLIVGITDALSMPSFQTIVPSIVEKDQIAPALALNATQFNLSRILGPAIAGVLLATFGAVACFALNAASYAPFILIALLMLPRTAPLPADVAAETQAGAFAGFREIARDARLRGALMMVLATGFFCGPLITFTPVLIKAALQGDVTHFSATLGAFGVGGLVGALVLMGVSAKRDRRILGMACSMSYGAVVLLAALDPWLWALPALLALGGMMMTIANTSSNTLLQSATSERLRGQTVSMFMLAIRGGLSIGSLLTGASVSLFGIREALALNGALGIIAAFLIGRTWLRSDSRIAGI